MELHHTPHDVPPLELCKDFHNFTQCCPLPRQKPQQNVGYLQLAGSLTATILEHECSVQVVLKMGEGANFCTGILLWEPPLPQILISLPIRCRLNFFSSRNPSTPVTPEPMGRLASVIALPSERVLPCHHTRSLQQYQRSPVPTQCLR